MERRPAAACAALAGAAVILLVCGCASDWARNRQADLTDAFSVGLTSYSVGAQANVGPADLGCLFLGSHGSGEHRIGFGGPAAASRDGGVVAGVVVPVSFAELGGERRAGRSRYEDPPAYRAKVPALGSVGFELGLVLGVDVRLDAVEFLDLVVGLVGLDLVGDDLPTAAKEEPAQSARKGSAETPGPRGSSTSPE